MLKLSLQVSVRHQRRLQRQQFQLLSKAFSLQKLPASILKLAQNELQDLTARHVVGNNTRSRELATVYCLLCTPVTFSNIINPVFK
jgi:hypothetical protein